MHERALRSTTPPSPADDVRGRRDGRRGRVGGYGLLITSALATSAHPLGAQTLPRLVPLYTVGCDLCEGPEAFGLIRSLAVLPDSTVVVLDRDEPMVRRIGAGGEVVGAFGRQGDGPGELGMPAGVATTPDGEIVVGDLRRNQLIRYTRDGTFLDSRRTESTVTDVRGSPATPHVAVQEAHWETMSGGVRLVDATLESVARPLPDTYGVLLDEEGEAAAAGVFSSAPGPDGRVAVAHGGTYLVKVFGMDGSLLHEIRRDVDRTERTQAEIDALLEGRRRFQRLRGGSPEAGGIDTEVDPLNPHFFAQALNYDARGRLWVLTARGGPEAAIFDLFEPDGSFLGEVQVPVRVRRFALGEGILAGVIEDLATGVERVRVWGLR